MKFKVTYTKGRDLKKEIIDAPDISQAMKDGYRRFAWDSVLEVTTPDDKPLQAS